MAMPAFGCGWKIMEGIYTYGLGLDAIRAWRLPKAIVRKRHLDSTVSDGMVF